ncbi:MAG TPA: helix-turn-helix transcriptional regulator, partial [Steroidobacteraceae bacterium]
MHSTTKRHLLQRAIELLGREQLAKRLGIPETMLDAWVRGDVTMPDGKLLVLAAALDEAAKS